MKTPRIAACAATMAKRAAEEGWDHQTYLAAVLAEEVAARETHGGQHRVKAAKVPADQDPRRLRLRLPTLPQGPHDEPPRAARLPARSQQRDLPRAARHRQTHLSIALGVQAARRGHRVAFASAQDWVGRLAAAKRAGRLEDELERLRRVPLVIVDEVGYIPFDPDAAALFFSLISSRYERASLIVSSNKNFSAWAEIFGDATAVEAMVDRLVHHAEVIVLQGDSYRHKDRTKEAIPPKRR
jgi:hypothetical protein